MIIIIIFGLGLCFGSFSSVLMTRLGEEISLEKIKGILFGFSRCPNCKKRLHAKNLIPVISFVLQKGKCEFCGKKIDRIYPVLEIGSAIIFVITFLFIKYGLTNLSSNLFVITNIFWIIVNRLLFSILIYDIKKQYLHVPFWFITVFVILFVQFISGFGDYHIAFMASIFFGGMFFLIYQGAKLYMKKKYKKNVEGIGEGDVMFAFLVGTLSPFIFLYNNINYNFITLLEIFLLFMTFSGIIGLFFAGIEIGSKKLLKKNIKGPVKLQSIAFLPAMIVSFRILLLSSKFLISILF